MSRQAVEPRRDALPALARFWWASHAGMLIDVSLALFIAAMLVLMAIESGQETIPYHFLFLALAVVYGFRVWPRVPTLLVVSLVTVATGWILYNHHLEGAIDGPELAEIPLMPALLTAMVWHARRRAKAQRLLQQMADERNAILDRDRDFFRDASHAIRTPVAIAQGHLELIQQSLGRDPAGEEIALVLRQLRRMSLLSSRLLALSQLDAGLELRRQPVELSRFVADVARNWSVKEGRQWTIACDPGVVCEVDAEWLELAVDALLENAMHHTAPGGQIELSARGEECWGVIAVADSGPGVDPADVSHIFDRFWHRMPPHGQMGSGLGLTMALATARAHDGQLTVANRPEGGALFELMVPRVRVRGPQTDGARALVAMRP